MSLTKQELQNKWSQDLTNLRCPRQRPRGRIELLTHLAYFGYCFNPASFYYIWDAEGNSLESVVIEVSNTP